MATLKEEKNKKNLKNQKSSLEKTEMLGLYRQMYLIRQFELACAENYTKGNIRGFLHLYIGQEATAVGSITCLNNKDYIVTHYRDHGHALARGLDVNRSMAELFGKKNGYRLVGDTDYENIIENVSKITPVPGGVGPMTITMLLQNVLKAYTNSTKIQI